MTVADLIEKLREMPQDAVVRLDIMTPAGAANDEANEVEVNEERDIVFVSAPGYD